jgi:enterochelin esterase family protein
MAGQIRKSGCFRGATDQDNHAMKCCDRFGIFVLLLLPWIANGIEPARLVALEIAGRKLEGNPLHDPAARRVAVFTPRDRTDDQALPMIYYLPGYGSSSEDFLAAGERSPFARLVQQMAADGLALRITVVDARNRWGGSQYLNSPAQGNYADYVCDEIVPAVEARFALAKGRNARIVAGHSSGGYGALMLGMQRQKLFGAVVGLSPDSDFDLTHRPFVEEPALRRVTRAELNAFMSPVANAQLPTDGTVRLMCGLSAAYAPVGKEEPGRFEWVWNDAGEFQQRVWQKWLDHDPLLIIRKNADAFAPDQRIYLDGAARDEWRFNISARRMFEVLEKRAAPVTFYEPPGGHSDHLTERLQRSAAWVFGRPLVEIR